MERLCANFCVTSASTGRGRCALHVLTNSDSPTKATREEPNRLRLHLQGVLCQLAPRMPTRATGQPLWVAGALLASAATHLAILGFLPAADGAPRGASVDSVEVSFVAEVEPSSVESRASAMAYDKLPAAPNVRRAIGPRRPASVSLANPEPPTQSPVAPPRKLHPDEVARGFVLAAQRVGDERYERHDEQHRWKRIPADDLFEGAGSKGYLSERDPPKLRRRSDGTYYYRGHVFEAIVEADGSVSFDDEQGRFTGLGAVFDLTDHYLRKRGEDPYREEKRWFLESTTEFRDELAQRWRDRHLRRALLRVRTRLIRIAQDAVLSEEEKSERIRSILEDTASDEAGEGARAVVRQFLEGEPSADEIRQRLSNEETVHPRP